MNICTPIPSCANPWGELPPISPFALEADHDLILKHNHTSKPDFSYNLNLHPEPFVGSLSAPIYLLALNPGLHSEDLSFHSRAECLDVMRKAAMQSPEIDSLYYLEQVFEGSPGAEWWRSKTRDLASAYGAKRVAKSLCCVQLYPYHSIKFSKVPGITSTVLYTASVVQSAITSGKTIVVMRSWGRWVSLVPQLSCYKRVARLRNPRNPCLSVNNLVDNFSMVQQVLDAL